MLIGEPHRWRAPLAQRSLLQESLLRTAALWFPVWLERPRSSIGRIEREIAGDLPLPAIAVLEQPVLVVIEFFARLDGEFRVRPFDDGVDRTGLLAEAAIDAFDHVDVVARRTPRSVVTARPRLNRNRLRRADRLAELAGDAALLAVRIAAQRVLAAIARRLRVFLMRIVQRRLRLEEVAH